MSEYSNVGYDVIGFPLDNGSVVPFRLLTYKEYLSIEVMFQSGSVTAQQIWNHVYAMCVQDKFFVDNKRNLYAGLPKTISEMIITLSGPTSVSTLISMVNKARQDANALIPTMHRAIMNAFSGYTMDMLEGMSMPNMITLFAQAEASLLERKVIEKHFDIVSGNTENSEPEKVEQSNGGYDEHGRMKLKKGAVKQEDIDKFNASL